LLILNGLSKQFHQEINESFGQIHTYYTYNSSIYF